ncbi:MAG: hypothetical protein ACI8ZO_000963 [Flavobacteriales bacterium]|jgi:hypothetical protein
MFGKYLKLFLLVSTLFVSGYSFSIGEIGNGIFLFFIAAIFVLLYFRNENIIIAFYHLRKGDMVKAEKALDKIKQPEYLVKGQQAYYYFLRGIMDSQTRSLGKAESALRKALNIGLRNDSDKAMAKLNLAGIAMNKRRKREATSLLAEAKKLDKRNMLDEQLKMMKQQLKRI